MAKSKNHGEMTSATKKSVAARKAKAVTRAKAQRDSAITLDRHIQPIIATIQPGDKGPAVTNLQDALLALFEAQIIWPLDMPGRPSPDVLQKLTDGLKDERTQSQFGEATAPFVIAFQVQQGLGDNLRGVVEDTTASQLNQWLKKLELLDILELDGFVVRGTVTSSDGKPLTGAVVRAFDRDMRKDQLLGEATADDLGQYIIRYGSSHFAAGDVPSATAPMLIVRAFAGDQQIDRDFIHSNSAREAFADFKADAPVLSEWEQVTVEVIPLLKGQGKGDQTLPPWELNDRDLDFIAEETGLQREHVRLWALAFVVGRDEALITVRPEVIGKPASVLLVPLVGTGLATFAIFYGWFRTGPTDLAELWAHSTDDLIIKFKKSVEGMLIPQALLGRLAELEATINQIKAARVLVLAPEGMRSSLGDLLGTLPAEDALPHDQQLTFAMLRNKHGDTDMLWQQAEALGLSKAIPALKRTLALGELTQGHPLLVNALQIKSDAAHPESVEFLTALERTDWTKLVFEHGVPPGSGLDRDGYIEQLQADVEGKFPTQMLSKQLGNRLGASEHFPTRKVVQFFEANPTFDLKVQHIEPYLNGTDNRDDPLREGLLQLQRIHALTASSWETGVLLEAGYGSASQIIHEGKPAFETKTAKQFSPERQEAVFAAAETVVTTVAVIATTYVSPAALGNDIYVVPAPTASEKALNKYPSLRSLFGNLDYCECRHCQSVLGPAAYLADLLHFLQRSKLVPIASGKLEDANNNSVNPGFYLELAAQGTVLGSLLQRRPDLADIELSCENTDTKIPYIDLVLEILENAVALPMGVAVEGININAEFVSGKVPEAVAEALRKTNIGVGKNLTVTANFQLGAGSPSVWLNWIINDGSHRWLVQHQQQQFTFVAVEDGNFLQAQDATGAVDALKNGTFNAEIKDKLAPGLPSQGLPIYGAPQIQEVATANSLIQGWVARYTRSIAIRITLGFKVGALETLGEVALLELNGTPLRAYLGIASFTQNIAQAFTSGTTGKINANVAQLLGLPENETYVQTWNPTQNWWELRVKNTAVFGNIREGLNVSGLTHQNSSIHEHLTSSPENRNPAAYDILAKTAVYPWALPFDLWLEETRAFLEALGIPRARLIDIARPQARLVEEAAALERLGLSKSEANLITAAVAATPWINWGLAEDGNTVQDHIAGSTWTGNWLEILTHLSMLLQQSGLSHREYLDLLQTSFVGQPALILYPPNECKTSLISLLGLNNIELTDHLNRIHIFTRLWRKSGWSMRDLSLALTAFGGRVTPATLHDLALLKRLSAGLSLPISVLVGCIDTLETQAWTDHTKDGSPIQPSLYNSVFQRQSLRSLTGFKEFALENLDNLTLNTSDRVNYVAASLGIKPDHVKTWIRDNSGLGINSANLNSLSRLYMAATLCRALRIAPDVLPDILELLGQTANPFRTVILHADPTSAGQARAKAHAMLKFVERVGLVRQSGFAFETLSYLLRHRVLAGKGNDAATKIEQQFSQTLTELRSALQTGMVLGDVSADNVKRQLARLGWYSALIDTTVGSKGLTYQPSASVEFSLPPPQPPVFPLDLRSRFTYRGISPTKAVLECSGLLTDPDFARIENLQFFPAGLVATLNTKYKTQLDDQVRVLASLLQIVELATLPTVMGALTGLTTLPVIPEALQDHFKFQMTSSTAGNLTLTGWLSSDDIAAVIEANPANLGLSAVVDSLQSQALLAIPAPTPPQTLLDAELFLREPDVERRYRSILLRLVARLERDLLAAQLSVALGCAPQMVDTLLDTAEVKVAVPVNAVLQRSGRDLLTDSQFLHSDVTKRVDRTTWPDQFAVIELLGKVAAIANRLTIKPEQLDWVLSQAFTVMDVLSLPISVSSASMSFDSWRQLVDLFHLRDVLPDGPARLTKIHTALKTSDFVAVCREFAEAFELEAGAVDAIHGACCADLLAFDGAEMDYNNPSRLLELAQLLQVIKSLGATSLDIIQLIQSAPDQPAAQLARTLFAASIDAHEFPERLRPISDRLRDRQRDALVAHLIHHDRLADSNELFDRYLIDVEMGSCMLTSRIKQAISSVQLFVQRCLLNLERPTKDMNGNEVEPGVLPISIDTQRWQWMKAYRVWEANRKVFLYPENWIEPELRDDKTEISRAFESDLLQSEITHDTALVAFRTYLDKMADIANLTVVSMFEEQTDKNGNGSIVHLIGRDNSTPYKHYYRQWKLPPGADFGTWTAWEEISIQADSEHILVFLYGGSVYLAWPTISAGQRGHLKWKVGMNLAKRTAAGWTKLKKGRGEIEAPMVPNKDERTSLAFRIMYPPLAVDDTVSIDTYGPPTQDAGAEPNMTEGPRIEVDSAQGVSQRLGNIDIFDPYFDLELGILASYPYEYADGLKQTHYRPATDSQINVRITYTVSYPKTGDLFNGYVPLEQRQHSLVFQRDPNNPNRKVHRGLLDQALPLSIRPYKYWTGAKFEDRETRETLVDVLKIEVEVTVNTPPDYRTLSFTKKFSTGKLASFTWHEDFIFELTKDPLWLPSADPNLVNAGLFTLKDDDSLELDTNPIIPWPLQVPADTVKSDTENYMSGHREVMGTHALMLNHAPSLNRTLGRYFIAQAQSDSLSTRQIWSYRDDQFALLFWRKDPGEKFRVVPFSIGGMRKLTSAVTKGRLLDAVALPKTFPPISLEVGAGIDFARDPVTQLDAAHSKSVTQIKLDFGSVPNSIYNWEVFFHNPLLVATQLSQAQHFEEAQRWFHLIFDPTTNEPGQDSVRYWRFLPFRDVDKGVAIDELLELLAQNKFPLKDDIDEWAKNPFRPHLIARHRLRSYKFAVVQKYLENLIAWGDQLFRRDTIETINEATQLYVLAARILGKRPASSPQAEASPKSYRDLHRKLDDFSNAWIPLEGPIITAIKDSLSKALGGRVDNGQISERISDIVNNMGGLYFCVPGNEKLSEYWDTVEDRLFNIRHCRNIDGVERQLPLFEPPIDPALLVRAVTAGLDLETVLADAQAPLPLYRFHMMLHKALELCSEVRSLGSALLSAFEKQDAEQLSLLRSSHELQMLKLVRTIKVQQQEEAVINLEALRKTREITVQRYLNYQRLLGKQNVVVPAEGDIATLESSALQLVPPAAGGDDTESLALISAELGHMGWLNDANNFSLIGGTFSALAGFLHMIPDQTLGATLPVTSVAKFGGSHLGSGASALGAVLGMAATNASFQASRSATIGGHQRRYDEWQFQSNTAAKELEQIDKQILANEIRKQIADSEITNHDQQAKNSQDIDEFMRDKYSSQQLYSWMTGQLSGVYFRTYQLAHDMAKRTERTYRFELGLTESSFIEFGYWDSLKKGLLSGERLHLDLRRMEAAYLDKNKREYEITKHVSLIQLDPVALIRLKETGQCEVSIPEALFDLEFPGHYLRRIKSVSLTIPCVTGPYSSVPCTLTLLKHSVRHRSNAAGKYMRDVENDDPRFSDSFGAIQSIVTSSAQNDSGMFETNLRDERYLPFEGVGAISTWRLELPKRFHAFDYDTISDVVLHVRYTARDGGATLKQQAVTELEAAVNTITATENAAGQVRLFSLKHEFPTEWHRFLTTAETNGDHTQSFALSKDRFPYRAQGRTITINRVDLFGMSKPDQLGMSKPDQQLTVLPNLIAPDQSGVQLQNSAAVGQLLHQVASSLSVEVAIDKVGSAWKFTVVSGNAQSFLGAVEDILVVCTYTVQ